MKSYILFFFLLTHTTLTYPTDDLISTLPDVQLSSRLFSGYLNTLSDGDSLHYVFIEAINNPSAAPLVLWLNGGPGCSSLLGFLSEIGPYLLNEEDGKLYLNEYAWNSKANILFFESPFGVGFTPLDKQGRTNSDKSIGELNLSALLSFFQKFPEYKGRDFYITGESYAGMYVPNLSSAIIDYNKTQTNIRINLKGILLGNPITDWSYEGENAMIDFSFDHALVSSKQKSLYQETCIDSLNTSQYDETKCKEAKASIFSSLKGIFVYDIYKECYPSPTPSSQEAIKNSKQGKLDYLLELVSACNGHKTKYSLEEFFNRSSIKESFHVDNSITFKQCNYNITEDYKYTDSGSLFLYQKIIKSGVRAWIFSGDTDMVVPFNGTLHWINKLNLPIVGKRRSWGLDIDKEFIQGYVTDYTGLSFITVRKVGHMVPEWNRRGSLKIFDSFIRNKKLN